MQFTKRQLSKSVLTAAIFPHTVLAPTLGFPNLHRSCARAPFQFRGSYQTFRKLPLRKLHIWEVATWEIVTWEVATWEIVTWEFALWKIPLGRDLTPPSPCWVNGIGLNYILKNKHCYVRHDNVSLHWLHLGTYVLDFMLSKNINIFIFSFSLILFG